jgi:predicted metalloprotease with PDZ domain
MKPAFSALTLSCFAVSCLAVSCALAGTSPGPAAALPYAPIPPPVDRAYPGEIHLSVDASDVQRRIVHVHETVTGVGPNTVLLYPKWLPGTHAPEGPIDRVAGIRFSAAGAPLAWTRDPVNMCAFHLHVPPGTHSVDVDFDYLSPTTPGVGSPEISRDLMQLEWYTLLMYPAGYFVRQIPAQASLKLPEGWQFGTSLAKVGADGTTTSFERVSVETLVDSPLYAGRHFLHLDLDPGAKVPFMLSLFADRPEFLKVQPEQLAAYRALVQQAYKLFGSHHFEHYDFLFAVTDQVQQDGLEHHQSSEIGGDPQSFTEWDKTASGRDLAAHELTHSWNGKFRRPAGTWTPNYDVPMQNSLLWVYEGQTEYWGNVLAGRAGLRTRQQSLEKFAELAAYYDNQAGRRWRSLVDTGNDEIINPRRPQSWNDWQRFEDYYDEGLLLWLEVDTLIRERSQGKRSLDDFARAFFGINDGSMAVVTYTFDDIVKALNSIEPYDWAGFLEPRVNGINRPSPLGGLAQGGYRLVYTDTAGDYFTASDTQHKRTSLEYSIGVVIGEGDKPGELSSVLWDSAAFKAGLTEGAQILAVNGIAYDADVLKDAIRAAHSGTAPIELIVRTGERYRVVNLDYHGGLRYPHLQRDASVPARLDDILSPLS